MTTINLKKIKYTGLFIAMSIMLLMSSFQPSGYSIDGELIAPEGTFIRISYEYNGRIVSDSVAVKNNSIMLRGSFPEAVLCTLSNSVNQQTKVLVLQNERVKIQGTISRFYYLQVSGALEDILFRQFKENAIEIAGRYRQDLKASGADFYDRKSEAYLNFHHRIDSLTLLFVRANPSSTSASLAIINSHLNSLGILGAQNCYAILSPKGKQSYYAKKLKSFIDASKSIEVGKLAPNVTLKDINGKTFDLGNYRGKYIMLDFWASWCKPCREEHPLLKKLNATLKDRNIMFVSISMDDNEKSWRNAVAEDGLTWTQLRDPGAMKGPLAELYSLKALPFNCLIDTQGKIIGTKLRGEALDELLAALFGKR